MGSLEEFKKIMNDFTNDLVSSYPELKSKFENIDYNSYYHYCKDLYPENFFHILYENNELFENEQAQFLLPEVNFKEIMEDETFSESSKKTLWKYIQLILFCVCNNLKNKSDFGDANYLFEAIKEDDLHKKIEETMSEMKNIFMNFDSSSNEQGEEGEGIENVFENMMGDISNIEDMFNQGLSGEDSFKNMFQQGNSGENPFENMMDPEHMKSHLSDIMGGKIGNLAKEIAKEASTDLGIDENMSQDSQEDFLKNMFKNPTKIMDIVKNIGNKLEEKFKSGEIKESELMEEAQEIMGKMKDMPGLKEMMKSMGMDTGGKFDFKGMANKMQQNMKQAKAKERMKKKLDEKNKNKLQEDTGNIEDIGNETFIWNDSNSNSNEPLKKSSSKSTNPKKNKGKKKKKKEKKNN